MVEEMIGRNMRKKSIDTARQEKTQT